MKKASKIKQPKPWEITLRLDVEGQTLPVEVEHPLKSLPYDKLPKKIDTSINVELLIAYLRSELPVTQHIRNWLADMLDPKCKTPLNMTLKDSKSNAAKKREIERGVIRRHASVNAVQRMKDVNTKYKDVAIYEHEQNPTYPIKKSALNQGMKDQEMLESILKQVSVIRKT